MLIIDGRLCDDIYQLEELGTIICPFNFNLHVFREMLDVNVGCVDHLRVPICKNLFVIGKCVITLAVLLCWSHCPGAQGDDDLDLSDKDYF